jgi:hypothetical protein
MFTSLMDGFQTVFVMDSIHRVLQAEKALKAEGIAVETQVTPREISADCGMVVLVRHPDEHRAVGRLRRSGIAPREIWRNLEGVFRRATDLQILESGEENGS